MKISFEDEFEDEFDNENERDFFICDCEELIFVRVLPIVLD